MTWTKFWDMHGGGTTKVKPFDKIYIETAEDEAKVVFFNPLGVNPEQISCGCCGEDYSIDDGESLDQLTAFHRNCGWDEKAKAWGEFRDPRFTQHGDDYRPYITPEEYAKQPDVLIIPAAEIKDSE